LGRCRGASTPGSPGAAGPTTRWATSRSATSSSLSGALIAAGGVAGFTAGWLADPEDPPLGGLLIFLGAAGIWSWLYDRLYQRLRRPQPTSRWARLIGGLGRTGKRVGPAILVAGVILTIAI
jgi:hypothetical protein